MDVQEIVKRCFDRENTYLQVTEVSGPSSGGAATIDENAIWDLVYDASNQAIRVVYV